MFVADYHETHEAFPLVYNLGRFSLEWNMVEQFFTALIWEFLGDHGVGMAVTAGLGGNQSKADVVLGLVRQRKDNPDLIDRVEFACRAFNILRENRNMLIHSHSIFPTENGKPHWRRATGRGPVGHLSVEANFEDLERLIAETASLGLFVVKLIPVIRPRTADLELRALPDKFPLPRKLSQPAPEDPTDDSRPPQSSRPKRRAKTPRRG